MVDLTIVTSLYRSELFLPQYIERLLDVAQDLKSVALELEVLLVVNDVTTAERALINALTLASKDVFVVRPMFVSLEPLYASWNRAIEVAQGYSIGMWNVDDVRTSAALIEGVKRIRNGCRLIDFSYELVKKSGSGTSDKRHHYSAFPYDVEGNNPLDRLRTGPFFMFERTLYHEVGPFDSRFRIAGDFEWQVRASRICDFCRSHVLAGDYFIHGDNLSTGNLLPVEENIVLMLYNEMHDWIGLRPVPPQLMIETWAKWDSVALPPAIQDRLWGIQGEVIYRQSQKPAGIIPPQHRKRLREFVDRHHLRPVLARLKVVEPVSFNSLWAIPEENAVLTPRHPWVPALVRRPLRFLIEKTKARNLLARFGLVRPSSDIENPSNPQN